MGIIYHITTEAEWQTAQQQGAYTAPSLAIEGFIHASQVHQVAPVANAFYRDVQGAIVLVIDEARLTSEVRYEAPVHPNPDHAETIPNDQLFPHIYGTLNPDAVVRVDVLHREADGTFRYP